MTIFQYYHDNKFNINYHRVRLLGIKLHCKFHSNLNEEYYLGTLCIRNNSTLFVQLVLVTSGFALDYLDPT